MNTCMRVLTFSVALALPVSAGASSTPVSTAEHIPPRVNYACPTPAPDVPESATVNGEHGEVYLGIYVSTHGRPKKIRVLHSSGYSDLDDAAVTAAATWHYIPGKRNEGTVSDWMALRMDFGAHETGATLKATSGGTADTCAY
jgi:TonB family protein